MFNLMAKKIITFLHRLCLTESMSNQELKSEECVCERFRNKKIELITVLPAKRDSDIMFCLQNYQGVIIDRSLEY